MRLMEVDRQRARAEAAEARVRELEALLAGAVDAWKVANGYDDFLAAYGDMVDKVASLMQRAEAAEARVRELEEAGGAVQAMAAERDAARDELARLRAKLAKWEELGGPVRTKHVDLTYSYPPLHDTPPE